MSPLDSAIHNIDCIGADLDGAVKVALEHCVSPADFGRVDEQLCVHSHLVGNLRQVALSKGILAQQEVTNLEDETPGNHLGGS
jgi:hypothetical protein